MVQRRARTRDTEQGEAGGVKDEDGTLKLREQGMSDEGYRPRTHRRDEEALVAKRLWGDAEEKIASDSPGESDYDCEHYYAENVEPGSNPSQSAAEPENERPRQIEDEQEGRIKGLENRDQILQCA